MGGFDLHDRITSSGTSRVVPLACEWARYNIRVNAVAPGYVHTALVDGLIAAGRIDAR